MGKYFGTDGFRGEANKVLTADHAYKIGRYLGWYYNQNHRGRIIIGKDTRRSSYMFEYALVAGITASGADASLHREPWDRSCQPSGEMQYGLLYGRNSHRRESTLWNLLQ